MKLKNNFLKLNLGSGNDYKNGFINIDAIEEVKPDLIMDLLEKWPFGDGSVSYVIASDILEHFTFEQISEHILPEISRVLITGGRIDLRVPNPDDIIRRFKNDPEVRNIFLYGATHETGTFGAHKVGFSKNSLLFLLLSNRLIPRFVSNFQTNFVISCDKKYFHFGDEKINYSTNWQELLLNSFKNKPSIWIANIVQIQRQLSSSILFKIFYKFFRNTPTIVLVLNQKDKSSLINIAHVSLAKIRTVQTDGLRSVIKEAKIRYLVHNYF